MLGNLPPNLLNNPEISELRFYAERKGHLWRT
jgi:hypothetical protein